MMESVGLQYNESFGTATKLLTSDSLITISIVPKIGRGAEYGANVKIGRVNGISSVPVKFGRSTTNANPQAEKAEI